MDKFYEECAEIVSQVKNKKNSVRSLIYASPQPNKKMLLRVVCETLRHDSVLQRYVDESGILKDKYFKANPILAEVFLYEHLFSGTGLRCSQSIRHGIERRSDALDCIQSELIKEGILMEDGWTLRKQAGSADGAGTSSTTTEDPAGVLQLPRYARVNTLETDVEAVKDSLAELGFSLATIDSVKRKRFRNCVQQLEEKKYSEDPLVPNLLIFHPKTDFHNDDLYTGGLLALQDKSSCLAPLCLSPSPGSIVIDVCAAPGMKTAHMAALMENKGRIIALDKCADRVATMRGILDQYGVSCAQVARADMLREPFATDKKYKKVKYALVDPPCSGSGIVRRLDHLSDPPGTRSEARLNGLGNLQAMMLKHTLTLPSLERVVYSTCSVEERENERVIEEVLKSCGSHGFQLVQAMPEWRRRGLNKFEFGHLCLRTKPDKDLTNGFFVAVLERS